MLKCRTLFEIIPPFANLALQVWIALVLMNILVIRDCLSNFLWIGLKLENLVNSIIKILCASYSLLWASFLNKVQMNFSEPIYWKRTYNKLENGEDSSSLDKTPPRFQVQRNELSVESKKCGQFMSQDCHSINERLCFKNLIRSSRYDSPVIELIKRNVGTQTLKEQDVLNNDCLDLQSPTNTSILSIFGEGQLVSAEACSNCLNNSDIGKPVTMKCKFTPVRHSSVSPKLKNGTSSRSLSSEFEKSASSSENQNVSRTTSENVPEEFVDIPLESPRNISQLLESPLCQINLDSMKNLRLTFSEDICIPTLSPKEKSIFRKSWNKLKLVRKVNKGFLEMKNLKRRNPDGISIISRQPLAGVKCTAAPSQKDTKNLTADVEDSEIIGCCSLFHKLKSKFDQKGDEGSVFYKKF
ncbi:uncharacterized protein [Parasteatoda tepidariorum]|uniref:uncharacterized protein n=1 Tax=Parasteatoda tepidariorum TaxID=114398 RepID=UPI001C72146E|nr:uncharacterized protein LOC107454293 [Parasteatoda tepidariorum]